MLVEVDISASVSVGMKNRDAYDEARPERVQLELELTNIHREVFADCPSPPVSDRISTAEEVEHAMFLRADS